MPQSKHAPALRWLAGSLTVAAVAALALYALSWRLSVAWYGKAEQ